MLPVRLAVILLAWFSLVFWAAPSSFGQQRQRRVFTNDDISRTPAPAPAAAPASPAAPSAEGTPGTEAAPSTPEAGAPEGADAAANLPGGLSLSRFLQGTLRRFHTEFADRLEQETDPARQERLKTMMNLTMQLLAQNQLYISEIQAQQPQEGEGQPPTQSPPAP